MGGYKAMDRAVHTILIYLNIFFIVILTQICFNVKNINYLIVVAVMLLSTLIFLVCDYFKKRALAFTAFIAIAAAVAALLSIYKYNMLASLLINADKINSLLGIYSPVDFSLLAPWFYISIPIIIILCMKLNKSFPNLIIAVVFVFISLLWLWNYKRAISQGLVVYGILSITTYMINKYVQIITKCKAENIEVNYSKKNVVICVLLTAAVICITAVYIPVGHKGKFADNIHNFFNPSVALNNNNSSVKKNGISNMVNLSITEIGGNLIKDNTVIFKVKTDKPRYLKADIKNIYYNNVWLCNEKLNILGGRYKSVDYTGLNSLYPEMYGDLQYMHKKGIQESNMTIYCYNVKIGTLFLPYFTKKIDLNSEQDLKVNRDFTFVNKPNSVKEYYVSYYDDNICDFDTAVSEGLGKDLNYLTYDDHAIETQSQVNKALSNDISKSVLEDYISDIDSVGVNNIDGKIQKFAWDIAGDSATNIEKIQKIRDYLKNNYKYSLKASSKNSDDAINRFLFQDKKGYCVHFASAMTLLCRSVGIPAQYVEGIKMSNKTDKKGLYVVTNSDAHAWTEVLLDPAKDLWCIVDCTPDTATSQDSSDAENSVSQRENAKDNSDNGTGIKSVNKNDLRDNSAVNKSENKKISSKAKPKIYVQKAAFKVYYCIYGAVIVLILFIFFRVIFIKIRKEKILNSKSAIPLYLYALKRIKTLGIIKPSELSDIEFVEELQNKRLKIIMQKIVQFAGNEFYGNTIVEFEKQAVYKKLEGYIKSEQNIVSYYLFKLVM